VELRDRLDDVAANGAPAQAEHARELLSKFHDNATDADIEQQARELIDAYLHDPYLTRSE
jgi:hypothetical protein